jgi:general secretion pathway protein G
MSGRFGERGFTLIELLIVMVILGMLAALVAPRMLGKVGKSRVKAAKAQIEMLSTALDAFKLDTRRYPTTEEGLEALVKAPPDTEGWDGPYLKKEEIPKDPWGRPYVYRCPGEHGDYDIISYGDDGQPGGEEEKADIVSWK